MSGSKSYSTSTGGGMRDLEDLSEIPSEYRELGDDSDSESDYRWIWLIMMLERLAVFIL